MNLSFVMYLAQPSSLDMLVLVGKVSCAAWDALQRQAAARGDAAGMVFGVDQPVLHVENGLLEIFRLAVRSLPPKIPLLLRTTARDADYLFYVRPEHYSCAIALRSPALWRPSKSLI